MSVIDASYREAIAELNEALAKAQAAFPAITRDKTVTVETKTGGRYSYSYADLGTILKAVRPALAAEGLAVVQLLTDEGGGPCLRTELRHKGGAMIGGTFPLPSNPGDPQALGSLLTYLRRYAITAALGIATDDDDDGAAAKPKPKRARAKPEAEAERKAFEPPTAKADPELAGLVADVQARFATLRKLEADLEREPRDWPQWIRGRLGLSGSELAGADHYRRALEILAREESALVAELARKTAETG